MLLICLIGQALVDTTVCHLRAMAYQSNSQSNYQSGSQSSSYLQSNLGVRGMSNILYALGSMGCHWRPAVETWARARTREKGVSEGVGVGIGGVGIVEGEDWGVPRSIQTTVIDALVSALTADTTVDRNHDRKNNVGHHEGASKERAPSNSQSNSHSASQSTPSSQSNSVAAVVSLEDLSHLLHALARVGFDFQVSQRPS